jgi:hypothetical protein
MRRPEYDTSESYWASVGPRILSFTWLADRNTWSQLKMLARLALMTIKVYLAFYSWMRPILAIPTLSP